MVRGYAWLERKTWIALAVATVVELVLALGCQGDFIASDPLWYANIAHEFTLHPGDVVVDNHPFVMRVGLTLPLALLYRVFGVSTLVTNLPCILAALGVLLVVYAAAPTPRAKLLGLVLVVACTSLLRHTTFLNVDLPCAALMAASVLFLSRRHQPRGTRALVAAIALWFAAFLVKETALWLTPVWIYVIIRDTKDRGLGATARAFAIPVGVGCVLAIAYLIACAYIWGSPLARFAGIDNLTHQHAWSLEGRPESSWVARLVWAPAILIEGLFGAALIPLLLAPVFVRGPERIWFVATLSVVLLYWFGSASLSSYSPLPTIARMAMPVVPCGLVLATLSSERVLDVVQSSRWRTPVVVGFLALLVIPFVLATRTMVARSRPETVAYAILREATSDPGRRVTLVCGDPRCEPISRFYFGFDPPPNLAILSLPAFSGGPRPEGRRVFAIVDLRRLPRPGPAAPRVTDLSTLQLPAIVSDPNVRFYDAGDGGALWDALRTSR